VAKNINGRQIDRGGKENHTVFQKIFPGVAKER